MDGFGHCLLLLAAEIEAPRANGWLILGVLAIVFIAPFLLGNLMGRLLRMNDLSGRIGVVLMSLFMALAPFASDPPFALLGGSCRPGSEAMAGIPMSAVTPIAFLLGHPLAAAPNGCWRR